MPILRYSLIAARNGSEIATPIADGDTFLRERILAHWRKQPLTRRASETGVREAIEAAFRDVESVLRDASLRA